MKRLRHIRYQPELILNQPVHPFRLYKGKGFWDLTINVDRWRWYFRSSRYYRKHPEVGGQWLW